MIFDLLHDLAEVLGAMPVKHPRRRILSLLDAAVHRDVHFIDRHPTTLFQSLWNLCWWHGLPALDHDVRLGAAEGPSKGNPLPQSSSRGGLLSRAIRVLSRQRQVVDGPSTDSVVRPSTASITCDPSAAQLRALLERWEQEKNDSVTTPWLRLRWPRERSLADSGLQMEVRGHSDTVWCVLFSPDGSSLISGSNDRTICVWDVKTGRRLMGPLEHKSRIWSLAASADGRLIAAGAQGVRVWHACSGQLVYDFASGGGTAVNLAFSPDGKLLAARWDRGGLEVWDLEARKTVLRASPEEDHRSHIAFSPDGRLLACVTAGYKGQNLPSRIDVWRMESDDPPTTIPLEKADHGVAGLWFKEPNELVLARGYTLTSFDSATGRVLQTRALTLDSAIEVYSSSRSADDRILAVAGSQYVRVWDLYTGAERCRLRNSVVTPCVACSPDGRLVATGSSDRSLRIWRTEEVAQQPDPVEQLGQLEECSFSPDGRWVKAWQSRPGGPGGIYRIWDASSGAERLRLPPRYPNLIFSPGGRYGAVIHGEVIELWDLNSRSLAGTLRGHTGQIYGLCFTADGRAVVSGGKDQSLRVWEIPSGQERLLIKTPGTPVFGVAASPDGKFVAGSCGSTRIWTRLTGREVAFPIDPGDQVAFSPDSHSLVGRFAGGGSVPDMISLTKVGDNLLSWKHSGSWSWPPVFSPDGQRVAVVGHGAVHVFDVESGETLEVVEGKVDPCGICSPRLRANGGEVETVWIDPSVGQPVAWFPESLLFAIHPSKELWVSGSDHDLILLELERGPPA